MEFSDKHVKLLFTAFAASMLIIFMPLNASAQKSPNLIGEASTGVSNLYKYLQHVNVTQNGWGQSGYNPQKITFNPYSSAPGTNHILWIGKSRPYEMLSPVSVVVDGLVIVPVDSTKSIYSSPMGSSAANMLYAFDQNTGKVIWAYPGLSSATVIDNQHLLCGTTMINPDTGQYLYTIPRGISIYVPETKMGFTTSGNNIIGVDFSNVTGPKDAWTSAAFPAGNSVYSYGDGKIFFGGGTSYYVGCLDATNGKTLWYETVPEYVNTVVVGNGKIYATGLTGGVCLDENTGNFLWRLPSSGRELGGTGLAYNKFYFNEADIALYCLDADTGGIVWKYSGERTLPFPAGPANKTWSTVGYSSSFTIADGKVYYKSLGKTAYAVALPPHWKSEDGTMWNPYNYTVIGQPGSGQVVCLDANYGNLIWKCGPEEIGGGGLGLGIGGLGAVVADGNLYFVQETYSLHVALGSQRPYSQYDYTKLINFEWFPPYVYCFGKGPTQFQDLAVSTDQVNIGENFTVSGKLVDLSPSIDHISILSNYKRSVGAPAPNVPVVLSFISSNGTEVPFAMVNTDNTGKFSYTWYPWETGSLAITVKSAGSNSYEAPDMTYTSVFVEATGSNLTTLLEVTLAVAIIVAVALPLIIYIRKPEP